jgi:serine/threonine protein kinase
VEGTTLDDRYKLYESIGAGGMAEVYRAEDLRLGRTVAIKILRAQFATDPKTLRRFLDEARSLAGFSHPNVVNVYDVGKQAERYYIVMEFVPGEDLRRKVETETRIPMRQALDIARQVAQGIGSAHRKGLVHRDLKPGNILISPTGEVKVADFGIARIMATTGYTEPGIVWGTTAYLSPEQVRGDQATPASDVYALGVVLYEMLAGEPPFQGEDRVAVALKHLHDAPPPFDDSLNLPRGVVFLVQKALAKNPADRFANADEMARALGEYSRTGETGPRPIVSATTPPPTSGTTRINPQFSPPPRTGNIPTGTATNLRGESRTRPPTDTIERTRQTPRSVAPPRASALPATQPDALTALLFCLAFVAVVGLIPICYAVFQLYF